MAKLKVPSLQHLARNWRSDPQKIKRILVDLAENGPTFTYDPLFGAVRDMLLFNQPYNEIVEGIRRAIKRADVRDNLLSVLPLLRDHFDGIAPAFVQSVDRRYYPVGRDLMVPFDPPLIYGLDGQLHFPWFSFWRSNPLTDERLSLFVTAVQDVLSQDPDLENAKFVILDFSAPKPKRPRELQIIEAKDIPRVSESEKTKMLSIFAEGYLLAQRQLAGMSERDRPAESRDPKDHKDDDQPELF